MTKSRLRSSATKTRKMLAALFSILFIVIASAAIPNYARAYDNGGAGWAPGSCVMYRLYNRNSGEHFYTCRGEERDMLRSKGWRYEGVGWFAPTTGDPVFRLYNRNAGDHHYTRSAAERDMLVAKGWRYEGVGWYSVPENSAGKKYPLYRQYNPRARRGNHNYTTNKAENDMLVRLGWRAEGIGWYAEAPGYTHGGWATIPGEYE